MSTSCNLYESPRPFEDPSDSDAWGLRNAHCGHERSIVGFGQLLTALGVAAIVGGMRPILRVNGTLAALNQAADGVLLMMSVGVLCLYFGSRFARLASPSNLAIAVWVVMTLFNAWFWPVGLFGLWLMYSSKGKTVLSPQYQATMLQTSALPTRRSLLSWASLLAWLVAAQLAVSLIWEVIGRVTGWAE